MASFCRNRYLDCRSVAAVVLGSMAILRSYGRTWRDRVVVVTGGTSGIGREFALRLAAEGAKVIACARKEVTLRELHTRFPQIEAIRCDVTVTPDVLALEAAIQDRYGRVDVLINNAGIMERVDLLDRSVSDERIAQEIAVNLTGPILLTRRLLPLLRCGRNPMIIMVTSGTPCSRQPGLRPIPRPRPDSIPLRWRFGGSCTALAFASSKSSHPWSIRRPRGLSDNGRCRRKLWSAGCCAILSAGGTRYCQERSACCHC